MKQVEIYTDGACSRNPGPGGYGAVLFYKGNKKEIAGFVEYTTNQEMELLAAVKALESLTEPCSVLLYSDSAYLINAFVQDWFSSWLRKGWKNTKNQPVSNRVLWEKLLALSLVHEIRWIKVKGHSDNEWNNRCDVLARQAIIHRR